MFQKLQALALALLVTLSGAAQKFTPNDKEALLEGIVTNFKGKPLAKEIILLVNETTKAVVKVNTDERGKFQVLIPVGATYDLKYKNFTEDVSYTKMVVPPDKDATYNVQIKIEPPRDFILDNVYFDTGKSTIKPSSNKALNDLVEVLKLKSTMVIEIQGHTDNVGSEESNVKLSQARADEVKKYLVSKGIKPERVQAKGYGPNRPIADNGNEQGRAMNRRTSLKVITE